jgi:hypothetical protein
MARIFVVLLFLHKFSDFNAIVGSQANHVSTESIIGNIDFNLLRTVDLFG